MDRAKEPPDLMGLMQRILVESGHHVKEISYYRLKSILKDRFGVTSALKPIERTLRDGKWMLTLGWGRGKDYLYRIPQDIQIIEDTTLKEKNAPCIKKLKN